MKRRGLGMVFERGSTWWIQYHWRGKRYRESSGSTLRMDAVKLLRRRMAEMGKGQLRGPDLEKTAFVDLVQMIRDDYTVNQRRSTRRLNTSLKALEPAFSHTRACDITLDRLNRYVSIRMATGIAPATAKLELTHLHKAFCLAERAGKAVCPHLPDALPELANLLRAQWENSLSLELATGQTVPTVFHWHDRGTISRFIRSRSIIVGKWPVGW